MLNQRLVSENSSEYNNVTYLTFKHSLVFCTHMGVVLVNSILVLYRTEPL